MARAARSRLPVVALVFCAVMLAPTFVGPVAPGVPRARTETVLAVRNVQVVPLAAEAPVLAPAHGLAAILALALFVVFSPQVAEAAPQVRYDNYERFEKGVNPDEKQTIAAIEDMKVRKQRATDQSKADAEAIRNAKANAKALKAERLAKMKADAARLQAEAKLK
eukprot:gb/GFBE01001367.1/.p1 GENE.gb/GFBE01001367.1/~~gb/GFBE01001367.1/.p1  ORF type:complete len:165 (+),score=36.17 gb/GFBE01001367.1/:1-495(+)